MSVYRTIGPLVSLCLCLYMPVCVGPGRNFNDAPYCHFSIMLYVIHLQEWWWSLFDSIRHNDGDCGRSSVLYGSFDRTVYQQWPNDMLEVCPAFQRYTCQLILITYLRIFSFTKQNSQDILRRKAFKQAVPGKYSVLSYKLDN